MNREIKFRAWDIKNKKMFFRVEHTYDCYIHGPGSKQVFDSNGEPIEELFNSNDEPIIGEDCFGGILNRSERFIVMQFTGLHKNGKEIYEGDIVKRYEKGTDEYFVGEIYWNQKGCGWSLKRLSYPHNSMPISDLCILEIIGNRFENSELLNE